VKEIIATDRNWQGNEFKPQSSQGRGEITRWVAGDERSEPPEFIGLWYGPRMARIKNLSRQRELAGNFDQISALEFAENADE
jgi:hypothetical protein